MGGRRREGLEIGGRGQEGFGRVERGGKQGASSCSVDLSAVRADPSACFRIGFRSTTLPLGHFYLHQGRRTTPNLSLSSPRPPQQVPSLSPRRAILQRSLRRQSSHIPPLLTPQLLDHLPPRESDRQEIEGPLLPPSLERRPHLLPPPPHHLSLSPRSCRRNLFLRSSDQGSLVRTVRHPFPLRSISCRQRGRSCVDAGRRRLHRASRDRSYRQQGSRTRRYEGRPTRRSPPRSPSRRSRLSNGSPNPNETRRPQPGGDGPGHLQLPLLRPQRPLSTSRSTRAGEQDLQPLPWTQGRRDLVVVRSSRAEGGIRRVEVRRDRPGRRHQSSNLLQCVGSFPSRTCTRWRRRFDPIRRRKLAGSSLFRVSDGQPLL